MDVSLIALVLLVAAGVLLVAAEWPRLQARLGLEGRQERQRARRRSQLRVISGHGERDSVSNKPADDFAASVQRDLESLPVVDPPDERS